jgi:hypothetical protein
MHPLLSTLKNIFGICKGITIILITAHRFINRLFAAASDADGIFRPFITTPAIHTHSQAINVRDFGEVPFLLPVGNSVRTGLGLGQCLTLMEHSGQETEPRSHKR